MADLESDSDVIDSDGTDFNSEESESEEENLGNRVISWAPNTFLGCKPIPFVKENKLLVPIPGENRPIDWFS